MIKTIDLSKYVILRKDRGGIAAKVPDSEDLYFMWEHSTRVEFDEYPHHEPEDAVIRAMIMPEGCRIQFRTNQVPMKNGYKGKGKPKNMAAIGFLSLEDLEMIVKAIKEKKY